jgi:Uma2 family endonuclease
MVMQASTPTRFAQPGRKPGAFVVRDPTPDDAAAPIDWSAWYLTDEEDMGEGCEQGDIIRTLVSSGNQLAQERGWSSFYLGADQFFAWVRAEPLVRVSPDVYLVDDPPAPPLPKMWSTWIPGHKPPRWAVEIVSDDWKKDYDDGPQKYAQLGTRELVIFDPAAALSRDPHDVRVALQVYRRDADGAFVRVYNGKGPVRSKEIDAYLVVRRQGDAVRLRIARDARGADVVPTADEAKQTAEARANAAEERARKLEVELAELRGGR